MQKSIDHRCDIRDALNVKSPNSDGAIKRVILSTNFLNRIQLPTLSHGHDTSFNDGISKGGPSQTHVRARAITCPIFQCFVCIYEVVSASCQPSCISKHSYMHSHASYMLMHLIKLLHCSYTLHFQFLC